MTATARTLPRHEPASELCLVLVTLSVVIGFSRVFAGGDFITPLVVIAVATHLALLAARRRGLGLALTTLVTTIGFLILTTWLFFLSTARFLLPTLSTLDAARDALQTSWSSFQEVAAPTFPQPGFLLAAAAGIYFAVFLADWAAFRLWAPIEALVPSLTLFIFTALVGSARFQVFSTALYMVLALAFVLEHRITQRERSTTWLTNQAERGSSWLLRAGGALAVIAVVAGVVIGPHLPGAAGDGLVSWRGNREGPSSRVTISPLVDIRSRLIDNQNVTLFTVVSPVKAYWRLTSLDTFDGTIWKSSGHYSSVDGSLPGSLPSGYDEATRQAEVTQTFRISALSALWLPAAFQPVKIDAPAAKVRYQGDTSTLIVDTNLPTSDGQTYEVTSVVPSFTPDELRAADPGVPADLAALDSADPPGLSDMARNVATSVTAGAPTAYDKAIALQTYFRSTGDFVYDTTVQPGHGDSAIDEFLTTKRGYCEQFAGTFAALARAVGLPARVAVGFTPGISDPNNPQRFEVKGEHAHAWPEVYLGQYGWVAFEPTPGRGAPNAQSYTGVAPQQAEAGPAQATSSSVTAATGPATTLSQEAQDALARGLTEQETAAGTSATSTASPWPERLGIAAIALGILALAYLVVVPSLLALRRHRRRTHATDPASRVELAWTETADAFALAGVPRVPSETAREFAIRAGDRLPTQRAGLASLATVADAALFGFDAVDEGTAAGAERVADEITTSIRGQVSRLRRVRHELDGRRLLPAPTGNADYSSRLKRSRIFELVLPK